MQAFRLWSGGRSAAFALLLLPSLARDAAAVQDESVPSPGQVALLRGRQNHLLIPALVNGHAATFLLDTGVDICFLQSDRAKAFGLEASEHSLRSGDRWFPSGRIAVLQIGARSFPGQEVAFYDPAQFHGPVPGHDRKPADGIIGLKFLRRNKAIINCRTQQLYLQSGTGPRLDLTATTRQLGFTRVPLTINRDGVLTVPCRIQGRSGNLALDTGAFVTVFDAAEVRRFWLEESPSKLSARTPSGRVRPLRLAQISALRIGEVPIPPQQFAIMDLFAPIKPVRAFLGINRIQVYDERTVRLQRDVWGLLGSELLYAQSAIIDLARMSLYLKE